MSAEAAVTRAAAAITEELDWGRLEWLVSGAIGNSTTMTVGRCTITEGCANPRHYHPNCDEVLHVVRGTIVHSLGEEELEMSAGDTISIPRNTMHNARNVGAEPALFVISFSSPFRETIGE